MTTIVKWLNPRRQSEADVVQAADNLDPNDTSPEAQQIRETAGDIRDHWSSEAFKSRDTN